MPRSTADAMGATRSNASHLIALATDGRTTDLAPDDAVALTALANRNLAPVEAVAWDAPHVEWSRYHAVLIRSTWDYHLRLDAFLDWAQNVEAAGVALWNPAAVIRWNADKRYLREIERAGVPVVPTRWIHRGTQGEGGSVLRDTGWRRVVVKPSVSATAFRTSVTDARSVDADPELLAGVLAQGDAMLQPFLPEVCETGEWSFMYFATRDGDLGFSHAVLKRPAAGDFRVQDQFGGVAVAARPPDALVHQATEAAAAVARAAPGPLLYARIDGVESGGDHAPPGTFLLMEAELIEPVLFLGAEPDAANRFAAAIARRVDHAGAART